MFRRLWCVLPFFLIGCKDSPPGPPPSSFVQLVVEDASCTEAWLKVSLTDSNQPRTVALKRDGQAVLTAQLSGNDTTLIDEGLLPNHAYIYQAVRMRDSVAIDASANAQLTTLDTTSHNWSFEIDTLGDGNSSVLYDVAIINDSLAYAVGEIYLRDSAGQIDPQAYNMAKWNGVTWQLMRIQFYTICGQASGTPYPAKSIFAFGPNDVWIAMDGSQLARWNGTVQTATICNPDPFAINRILGEGPNSIWAVGLGGRFGHYTNGTWRRIESGTTLDVYDVYGHDEAVEILAVAARQFATLESSVLSIAPTGSTILSNAGIVSSIRGIWFVSERKYYIVGGGMYRTNRVGSGNTWESFHSGITQYYEYAIAGNAINDIFSVGSFGEVLHFNGAEWKSLRQFTVLSGGEYYSVSSKKNFVVAVGYESTRAVILRGYRQ